MKTAAQAVPPAQWCSGMNQDMNKSQSNRRLFTLMKRFTASLAVIVLIAFLAVLILHQDSSIRTDTWINRPPHTVWKILTATSEYPNWNPEITRMTGQLREGNVVEFTNGSGADAMTFHPTVLVVHADQELRWKGYIGVPGIFDGEHSFVLENRGKQTHFIQSEKLTGLFAGRLTQEILRETASRMQAMNVALKVRTEALPKSDARAILTHAGDE